jgi:hypothetical protein
MSLHVIILAKLIYLYGIDTHHWKSEIPIIFMKLLQLSNSIGNIKNIRNVRNFEDTKFCKHPKNHPRHLFHLIRPRAHPQNVKVSKRQVSTSPKRQVYKMSGLQKVRSSKRPVAKHPVSKCPY